MDFSLSQLIMPTPLSLGQRKRANFPKFFSTTVSLQPGSNELTLAFSFFEKQPGLLGKASGVAAGYVPVSWGHGLLRVLFSLSGLIILQRWKPWRKEVSFLSSLSQDTENSPEPLCAHRQSWGNRLTRAGQRSASKGRRRIEWGQSMAGSVANYWISGPVV